MQEAEALQREMRLLQTENGQMRREVEVNGQLEVQYAQRTSMQVPNLP
jgi:hypothetical protein